MWIRLAETRGQRPAPRRGRCWRVVSDSALIRPPTQLSRFRQGTAATEFALVLPLLVLIGVGCLDVGHALQYYSVMSSAANAAAQRGATQRYYEPHTRIAWESHVREAATDELASLVRGGAAADAFDIRIETDEPPPTRDQDGLPGLPTIAVSIDYDYPTLFHWPGFPRRIPLHCESVIRQYR